MNYKQGDLVFVNYPFDDTNSNKKRPAIIVGKSKSRFNTYIVAKVTSNGRTDDSSFWLDNSTLSFPTPHPSQVRCDVLQTISEAKLLHKFSTLEKESLRRLCDKIKTNFDVI
jgi:mRNA interferase MazF